MNPEVRDHYQAEFARLATRLPGAEVPWVRAARAAALAQFVELGFPTRQHEDWKYTSVTPIENSRFSLRPSAAPRVTAAQIAELALPGALLLVFVDGRHVPELSRLDALPAGARILSVAEALARDPESLHMLLEGGVGIEATGFATLNAAFLADGVCLDLAEGVVLDAPIQLLFLASEPGIATHSRNLIRAGTRSSAVVIEHHVGLGDEAYCTNCITDIALASGAQFTHHKLQQESAKAFHIAALRVNQGQDSRFHSGSFALGGGLVRVDIHVSLDGGGAECALDGLYLTDGRQHVDHHTCIDHTVPRGTSREFYKGILDGASRAVFNGKVIVRPDAQQSDAFQTNCNLLLSEKAEIDTKPQLEIFADDVKCGHGATVGQLDPEQIFYLRSRGLDDAAARGLLTFAFAAEVIERVPQAALKQRLEMLLRGRSPQAVKELL